MTGGDTFDGWVLEFEEGQNKVCVCTTVRTRTITLIDMIDNAELSK